MDYSCLCLYLRGDGIQVEQMSPNDDISNFLSRSARPCCCSLISVSSSLPLGTRSTHTQPPWELFNGCTVLENQTRQRWSDRQILLSKRDRALGAGACTHLWYLLENNETSPQWGFFQRSVKHTNTIYQVCTNTIYQVRLYKFKYNTKSVWKQSLCIRCIVAECFYSQKMNTIRWWNPWIQQPMIMWCIFTPNIFTKEDITTDL